MSHHDPSNTARKDEPVKDTKISRRTLLKTSATAGAGLVIASSLGTKALAAPPKSDLQKVPRKILGKTGQKVPILLMGGGVDLDPVLDPKLAEAFRYGVDYIDAADCYTGGKCEPAVGSFHKKMNVRDKIWITSKSDEHDPKGFAKTLRTSLQRLQTSWIDLYFLHALQDADYLSPDLEKVVAEAKKKGQIRYFGFSCHHGNVAELLHKAAKTPWVDAVMFRYNFRKYGDKELNKAMDACAKANVGLIAMKTQGSASSFEDKWKKVEKSGKWTKHQAVLKAVWADERIAAAVSHMDTLGKLRENVAAALNKSKLSRAESDALERYAAETRSLSCDGCDHICGAAAGAPVRIGDTLRYLMYHDVYAEPGKARRLYGALPESARRFEGADLGAATRACPHGVDITTLIGRAQRVLAA